MNLKKFNLIGLDTNIFSYQFHQDPQFGLLTKKIFDELSKDNLQAVTSVVTLIEILSVRVSLSKVKQLKELFLRTPNLSILDVNHEIALEAAAIRRKYGFRTPDAIQLATAKLNRAKAFVTNDERLKNYLGLKIILLSAIK
ncbi:hypothetical protein A3B42_00420 [Candidatus Daviesbacteria bacterium RIFCSPLOWO2_01_FULL_38_10]|nr:MAG: hypothetical protein A3B42_00420 [Candidatus Daviesbacteria bacterium RIFCSPLOWO2_01_FULL_38_10]OGE44214.1 MAG: hypothetical protein A3E67_04950 [Candidatus Daviesbacteria bacterium RIFCSPHIGHO2_12_FULL_38_25]OGE68392.1 MAG: hypothetical protein A3H81_02550 [Candidatus Daviesbacteria bacterium RIFCSPLOWO2_02_FULL_38_18]OGE72189.1 MAG: hypothetical protein A3H18_01705 [Candidatus Daviesbacteria bacterium RIFCSPLOWO2_12_FULL_38_10]HBQ50519.1 hypothetical protein [Candidatus Daviesbacteria